MTGVLCEPDVCGVYIGASMLCLWYLRVCKRGMCCVYFCGVSGVVYDVCVVCTLV